MADPKKVQNYPESKSIRIEIQNNLQLDPDPDLEWP